MTITNKIINYHILRITLRLPPPPFLSDTEIKIIKQPLYIVIDNLIQIKPNLWYRNYMCGQTSIIKINQEL